MTFTEKLAALETFYKMSFESPRFVASVATTGSYAKKVRAFARLGKRSNPEVEKLCEQVDHLRRAFKIMDDLIDEDIVRDSEPAFWVFHGAGVTIEQAAWETMQARLIARELGTGSIFETRLCEVISGARLEVEMENPDFKFECSLPELWHKVVKKEAAFRQYLTEALRCEPNVVEAAYQDGVAAQILDDGLSALHGKDGRSWNSDEALGRLTYMRAFGVLAADAVAEGQRIKNSIAPILGQKGGPNGL